MPRNPSRSFRLGDLVRQFGGAFRGDETTEVTGFAPLQKASPGQLAFLTDSKYKNALAESAAAAVLISPADAAHSMTSNSGLEKRLWIVTNPYAEFARIAQFFVEARGSDETPGIHPTAVVSQSAEVHRSSSIGAFVVIGENAVVSERVSVGAGSVIGDRVAIGADTRLHPSVTIYADCSIGERGIVHSGAVIGADGFGFAKDGERWIKIPQMGRVLIGDDCEIGANTTIDRGALEDTVIGNDVKLDNLIQIGHNVRIGDHTAMAGCTGVAGSTVIGRRCTVGGAGMVLGHLDLADDVHISAATVVTRSISEPGQYTGFFPLSEHDTWSRNAVALRNLHGLRQRVKLIEKQLPEKRAAESRAKEDAK